MGTTEAATEPPTTTTTEEAKKGLKLTIGVGPHISTMQNGAQQAVAQEGVVPQVVAA